ncbi:MAG: DUF4157 domain-containing protein [Deltaproteobacteria bacterium]|jgi:Zn-dependent peptidase ImmA (M78 family)|nr:DUF4157 domain-containing protein [Deltaproteobacteria bacterium]
MKTSIQKKEQNATLNASKKQTRPPMNTVGLDSDDHASIREILSKQALQPKLKISQPNDKYEQEADRIAEMVLRMPEADVQRKPTSPIATGPSCKEELIQKYPLSKQIVPVVQRQPEEIEGDEIEQPDYGVTVDLLDPLMSLSLRVRGFGVSPRSVLKRLGEIRKLFSPHQGPSARTPFSTPPGLSEADIVRIGCLTLPALCPQQPGLTLPKPIFRMPRLIYHDHRIIDHFIFSKIDILKSHLALLDQTVTEMKNNPSIITDIGGHTDSHGIPGYDNQGLSIQRAHSVEKYLHDLGVANEQIWNVYGLGSTRLRIPNDRLSKEAAALNRRVELDMRRMVWEVTLPVSIFDLRLRPPETGRVMRKPEKEEVSQAPEVFPSLELGIRRMKCGGSPLSGATRAYFEPRFGIDFSKVRIHTDSNVAQMNKALGAKAFTHGPDIYFNAGMYDTNSNDGKRLIAHELTHVVQQTGGQAQRQENPKGQIARAPEKTIQRAIKDVQQAELSTFFSQPEPLLPQPLQDKYLVDPALMATQRSVIRALVDRVQGSEAPLTANQLQTLVLSQESDLGTALIICHNVTKALSRGNSPINWSNVSRDPDPLVYSLNGTIYTFDPDNFHPDAEEFARNQESVFYAMLSPDQFGQRDDGDWYHYYAMATISYYRASGNLQTDNPSQLDPFTQFTGELVSRVADALRDSSVTNSPAYEGWLMANAMSFLEGGHYGQSQDEVNAETNIHIQGASGGLATVGRIPEEIWQWYVPKAGSISIGDLSNFQFRGDMIANIRAGIDGYFELTIISGTIPDHWYDTPDSFVKLPGLFSSRTTTKDNTSTPVWNETLTILHHDRLVSVTLQLYDADPLVNDHISDFTDDLRPQGQRSRNFSLTSGSSTLEVRLEATGNVVLATP